MDFQFDPLRALTTMLVVAMAGYAYLLWIVGRKPRAVASPDGHPIRFVFLIPCLNEARVIGQSLRSLTRMRGDYEILVVDDASDDRSAEIVRAFPSTRVRLIQRPREIARTGKGAALNFGYAEVAAPGVEGSRDADRIVVGVFDADCRAQPDFLERVAPYFNDPAVAGVQVAVRMYNYPLNILTFWQNLEFAVWGRVFARAKDRIGSATLGGNGQCVRLTALRELGVAPWRPSLTEDLDLSLRLILRGWKIRFCPEADVAQQAVPGIRQLLRQRARWVQGHLVCWEYMSAFARAPLPLAVRLDLLAFLLLPITLVPIGLATIDGWSMFLGSFGQWSVGSLVMWYVLAFATAPLTAWAFRDAGETRRVRVLVQAHLFLAYAVFWVVAALGASWSVLRGDRSWAKTTRVFDPIARGVWGGERVAMPPRLNKAPVPRNGGLLRLAFAVAVLAASTMLLVNAVGNLSSAYEQVVTAEQQAHIGQ